ncbi:hypothetical protein ACA910_014497 [Epithemia clementina (nom. ined.)]
MRAIPRQTAAIASFTAAFSTTSPLSTIPQHQQQQMMVIGLAGVQGPRTLSKRRLSSTFGTAIEDFNPNPPPGTHGTPVFENIDFDVLSRQDVTLESQKRNMDPDAVFVVTGASRGMGLQFVKSLMDRTKGTIVACCRSPNTADQLLSYKKSLNEENDRLVLLELDLENQQTIESAGSFLREKYTRVDALFNVAGLLGDGGKTTPGPERALAKMDRAWLEKTMAVNTIGPIMFCKEVAPLLLPTTSTRNPKDKHDGNSRPVSVVVNISARVGSIADNELGGWYSYRMSKSALNQATRTMALEFKRRRGGGAGAWAIALHPGTTETDLSLPFQANVKPGSLFPVKFTVHKLLNIVDALQEKHSGGFYDWAGQALSF